MPDTVKPKMSLLKWCVITISLILIVRAVVMAVVPLTDPSEARYGNICKNMTLSGNFVEPKLIHRGAMTTFDGKPPLYFQMGATACKIFGINEFSVRLPALLCGILTLLIVYGTVKRLSDSTLAARTALLLAMTPFFCALCGLCLTDMALLLSVTGALCSYMLFTSVQMTGSGWLRAQFCKKRLYSIGFFFFLGLGMLAKGPVAIVLAGMPVFLYVLIAKKWNELKDHAWIPGLIVFFAVAAPWYVIMQSRDPDFLEYFFVNENFKRFLFKSYGDKFGAGREFFMGMALVWFLVANISALSFLVYPLLNRKKRAKMLAKSDFTGGNALLAIPALASASITIFWCLTSRIPVYYILPTVPMFSITAAILLTRSGFFESDTCRKTFRITTVILGIGTSVVIAAFYLVMLHIGLQYPEPAYAEALRLLENDPSCKGKLVYFSRRMRYSGEFYMGKENLYLHDEEDVWYSLKNSKDSILLINEDEIRKKLEGYYPERGGKFFEARE